MGEALGDALASLATAVRAIERGRRQDGSEREGLEQYPKLADSVAERLSDLLTELGTAEQECDALCTQLHEAQREQYAVRNRLHYLTSCVNLANEDEGEHSSTTREGGDELQLRRYRELVKLFNEVVALEQQARVLQLSLDQRATAKLVLAAATTHAARHATPKHGPDESSSTLMGASEAPKEREARLGPTLSLSYAEKLGLLQRLQACIGLHTSEPVPLDALLSKDTGDSSPASTADDKETQGNISSILQQMSKALSMSDRGSCSQARIVEVDVEEGTRTTRHPAIQLHAHCRGMAADVLVRFVVSKADATAPLPEPNMQSDQGVAYYCVASCRPVLLQLDRNPFVVAYSPSSFVSDILEPIWDAIRQQHGG
mmetsp:Transcript_2845/g.10335  ORF Transcript_2845/g.10335 Transcript_2845/m.10335 type:complete len:373 (+) Transcript_2845:68-1186(+)|eukprot:scaffold5769_cov402-Prasinococcus_capsulatus_cf.AAC.5